MGSLGLHIHLFFHFFSFHIGQSRSLKLGSQCNNDYLYCVRDKGLSQLISSFVLSFFFLSIYVNVKFFVKDFSGTIKARSLKLGILCNDGDLYHVRNSGLYRLICSSVPLFFFPKKPMLNVFIMITVKV